jgi:uncharacterized membrane protein
MDRPARISGRIDVSTGDDGQTQAVASGKTMALAVYILYLVGYFVGITWLIGVIIAYTQRDNADPVVSSHSQNQITIFWASLVYVVIGSLLALVLIGWLVLAVWFVWSLIRIIKGLMALNNNLPIDRPTSWGF